MNNLLIIAIDGFSSCGKSTLAKDLAQRLSYKYIDSGAMYRAVTLFFLDHQVDLEDKKAVQEALDKIDINFSHLNSKNHTILNGKDVENEIRNMRVSNTVSMVAAIPEVRNKLVEIQHNLGKEKGIVMDGRDITTVVFPDAEIKIFVTADIHTRTKRRFDELQSKGKEITMEEVQKNLEERDYIDTTRSHSPLTQVPEAFELDNTYLNREEQVEVIMQYIESLHPR